MIVFAVASPEFLSGLELLFSSSWPWSCYILLNWWVEGKGKGSSSEPGKLSGTEARRRSSRPTPSVDGLHELRNGKFKVNTDEDFVSGRIGSRGRLRGVATYDVRKHDLFTPVS